MTNTLRSALRSGTFALHERLDAAASRDDLARLEGLSHFLRLQHAGLHWLQQSGAGKHSAGLLAQLCKALDADLRQLGLDPRDAPRAAPMPLCRHAVDYIVLGSRLGTVVLKNRWSQSTDAAVQRCCHYFSVPHQPKLWQDLCADLAAQEPDTAQARQSIADAQRIFEQFITFYALVSNRSIM